MFFMENQGYTPERPDASQRIPEGATVVPEKGKHYKILELPEGVLAVNFNEYRMPNGILVEVDENGVPKNEFLRKWTGQDEFKGKLV